jgi:hypothetical protein
VRACWDQRALTGGKNSAQRKSARAYRPAIFEFAKSFASLCHSREGNAISTEPLLTSGWHELCGFVFMYCDHVKEWLPTIFNGFLQL